MMQTLNSVTELENYQHLIDSDTLILLDVDNTLITPKSKVFHMGSSYQPTLLTAEQRLELKLSPTLPQNPIDELKELCAQRPEYDQIIANWRLTRQVQLVEEQWLKTLVKLKAKATVYALTKMDTGRYSVIPSMEQWRYTELTKFGLTFTEQLNKQNQLGLLGEDQSNYAIFIHGIALTGKFNKTQVLTAILAKANRQFSNIIFVDDRQELLQAMAEYCSAIGMQFTGLHYPRVGFIPPMDINFAVVKLQQDRLFNAQVWLEDEQALAELTPNL